jgi:2-phosphoglycerate kinase
MDLHHILIGGTSHVGKSKLAAHLAARLQWPVTSTDDMARHPGRPWPDPPPQVDEFYAGLSPETIYWFLKVHHDNMWPLIAQRLASAASRQETLILEGSALRPERMASLRSPEVVACLLHVSPERLVERMHANAAYRDQDRARRAIIDRFIDRSLRDSNALHESARRNDVVIFDAEQPDLIETVLEHFGRSIATGEV